MKRPLRILLIVIAASIVLFAVLAVKRVPDGFEAVVVNRDGKIDVLSPGLRFVPSRPRAFVLYPSGEQSYRCPEAGRMLVLTQEGDEVEVAFRFDVTIPEGASRTLYERFSEDFDGAFKRLVVAAAEIEAASSSSVGDPERYLSAVTANVRKELSAAGASVRDSKLEHWGGFGSRGLPSDVSVSKEPPCRLVVVGVDGADWLNIKPLVDAGKLPNFKTLIERGATGPLRSEEPLLSPLLWTTMATGKYPEVHGILNFTVVDSSTGTRVPITRFYRQVDAFWNMLGDYNRKVCVAGWLATDPAEKINGVMVTDKIGYLAYAPDDTSSAHSTSSVYPPERIDSINQLVVHSGSVSYRDARRMINISEAEFKKHRDLPFDPRDSINNLILLYASTMTFRNVAIDLMAKEQPDVMAVYFEFVDAVSHLFMLHAPPRTQDVTAEEFERFKDAVEQSYVVQDEILGDIMDALDDNSVLMVISDHGFKAGRSRLRNRPEIWAGNAAKWHRLNGIVALYGKGIRKGHSIQGASILDVTPTILALQGLPRAADMPGKILASAFERELQEQMNPNTVATLNREREVGDVATSSAASAETMKKLEALGYLTPDNADAHNNLGQRYQQRGEYEKAIAEYKKAIASRPGFYSAYNNIAVCYGKLKRYPEAEAALVKTIELKPDDFYAMNNLAVMFIETHQLEKALVQARKCVATEPGYVNGRLTLGSALAMTGDFDHAEREFREALRIEPENPAAKENLRRLEQVQKGN